MEWLESFGEDPGIFLSQASMALGAVLALMVIAARLRWITWRPAAPGRIAAPPSDLPAPAVSLLETGAIREETVLSTIFEMGQRGTLRLVWITDRRGARIPYLRAGAPSDRPWEIAFQKVLPGEDQDVSSFYVSKLPDEFGDRLGDILVARGFYDQNPVVAWRQDSRERDFMYIVAVAAVFLVCLGFIILRFYDDWLQGAYWAAIVFGGLLFLRTRLDRWFSRVGGIRPTRRGILEISAWRAFKNSFSHEDLAALAMPPPEAAVARRRVALEETAKNFQAHLPYAMALGVGRGWMDFAREAGAKAPEWTRASPKQGTANGFFRLESLIRELRIAFGFAERDDL